MLRRNEDVTVLSSIEAHGVGTCIAGRQNKFKYDQDALLIFIDLYCYSSVT
jgi:hypothetical protein